jgi:hypothetical protein
MAEILSGEEVGALTGADPKWSHVATPVLANFARAVERAVVKKLAEPVARLPLSEDYIERHIGRDEGDRDAVIDLVREVERAHGIGAPDNTPPAPSAEPSDAAILAEYTDAQSPDQTPEAFALRFARAVLALRGDAPSAEPTTECTTCGAIVLGVQGVTYGGPNPPAWPDGAREAMQMALEALTTAQPYVADYCRHGIVMSHNDAIDALGAQLAQIGCGR